MMRGRTVGEGTHKGRPYGWIMRGRTVGEGTHKGCPYGWMVRARTVGEGTHKGGPQARPPKGEERVKRSEEREHLGWTHSGS